MTRVPSNRVSYKVDNPARRQLNMENGHFVISLSTLFAPENLVSRDEFDSPVLRQPTHLHTQAEPSAYLRDSSRVPWRRPFIYFKPPYATGLVPSLQYYRYSVRNRVTVLITVSRFSPRRPRVWINDENNHLLVEI